MSTKKTHDAILFGKAGLIGILWNDIDQMAKFCQENIGEDLTIQVTLSVKTSAKMKMYAYWYKAIVPAAVICFTQSGYSGVDNIKADFMLRTELARDYVIKPDGDALIVVMDKRGMTKPRLHKLVSDALWFLEEQFGHAVPSSEEYKLAKDTGINFKPVK